MKNNEPVCYSYAGFFFILDAGIVGLGGATFPTHVKLSPPEDKRIDTLILNGVECEPYLTADHRLMLEQPENILAGMRIIMHIMNIKRGIIGIEKNKPDAITIMQDLVKTEAEIEVYPLNVKYPQGAEKQLIFAVTKRRVPAGKLPMEVRCLVQNVGTAKAVYEAVALKKPLIERIVTVAGCIKEPKNVRVPIGTQIKDVIEFCGGFSETPAKIIVGGPMMGVTQYSLDVPVTKGVSGILALSPSSAKKVEELQCINCGMCLEVCPMDIMPNLYAMYVRNNQWEKAKEVNVLDCMECGACSYVCPTGQKLVQYSRYAKFRIMELEKAKVN